MVPQHLHGSEAPIPLDYIVHMGQPHVPERLLGDLVDSYLFSQTLLGLCIEPLEEFAEADHVDKFMGRHIHHEGKQLEILISLQGRGDVVILETDLEKVVRPGLRKLRLQEAAVSSDLREGAIGDLLEAEGGQGPDIVPHVPPVARGDLEIVGGNVLGDLYRLGYYRHLVRFESTHASRAIIHFSMEGGSPPLSPTRIAPMNSLKCGSLRTAVWTQVPSAASTSSTQPMAAIMAGNPTVVRARSSEW